MTRPGGRPKESPEGTKLESFMLWPEHLGTLQEWMTTHECNRSEAIRMMIDTVGAPDSRRAIQAARKARQMRDKLREQSLAPWPLEQRAAEKRARKAAAARARRARSKQTQARA